MICIYIVLQRGGRGRERGEAGGREPAGVDVCDEAEERRRRRGREVK